ncbi:unnamed protein product [Parnassius apollo]|uniref:(apollo) hypothetical protein n=1 Tax=Parnassius apollo TaxID=110799 RepID=A0A8S3X6F8_PARAO|nr:unnamed protein product [Parnassius apollo]
MNIFKLEIDISKSTCHGCLSSDRNISPVGDLLDLFCQLSKFQGPEYAVLLCWECRSILKKTWRFQQQIQQAQFLLHQPDFQLKKEFSLSTLSSVINSKYDNTIYENCQDIDYKPNCKVEHEISNENESEEIKDIYNGNISETDFDDIPITEDLKNELIKEEIEIETNKDCDSVVKKSKTKNEKKQRKYMKWAIVTENVINGDIIDSYFIRNNLNENVIEEILERRNMVMYKKDPHYICKICKVGFHKNIDLKRHKLIKHPPPKGPYKCSECKNNGNLLTLRDLHQHLESHVVFKCKQCPEVCRSSPEMNRHLLHMHQYTYCCNECGMNYNSFREFIRHHKDLHERVICDHCGKSFIKKQTLEKHIKRKHLPPVCYTCGRLYKSFYALESHSRLSHPELHYDLSKTELSYCVECNKQFKSVYTYRRHLYTAFIHRPPKPVSIPCPECGKVFTRKLYMNNHYRLFHVKKSRHYCELCNRYYVTAYALRNHRLRVHEKTSMPKDKICDICGRGFSTNRVLIHHRRTHTGEKPHKCSQCPAAFAQLCAKKSHERSQHKIF